MIFISFITSKKNLFYALTLYHILCVVTYIIKKKLKHNIILISDITVNRDCIKISLEQSGLFDEVIVINDRYILDMDIRKETYTNGELEQIIKHKSECVETILPFDVNKFSNIYVCADHFPFGIYLNYKKIKYNYFEDGAGQQSFCEKTIALSIKPCDLQLWNIVEYLHLFGRNSNVIKRFINIGCQQNDEWKKTKAINVDFDVVNILRHLNSRKKNIILKIFNMISLKLDSTAALILPVNNVSNGIITEDEQIRQSALLADHFAQGYEVYLKPHPNDNITKYSILKNWNLLDNNFPAELLSLNVDKKIGRIITTWSTAGNSLKKIARECICTGEHFEKNFFSINVYYVLLLYFKEIGINISQIDFSNSDNLLMKCLSKYGDYSHLSINNKIDLSELKVIDTSICDDFENILSDMTIIIDIGHIGDNILKTREYHTLIVEQDLGYNKQVDYIFFVGGNVYKKFMIKKQFKYSRILLISEFLNEN